MVRVAINGFGRIGRTILKAGIDDPDIQWVAVNDLTNPETLAYLFKYDSTFGIFNGDVKVDNDKLIINGKEIKVLAEKEPHKLPWKDLNVDVVIESTGLFTDGNLAREHIAAGAKKVLISAPAKNHDFTIIKGVNEKDYNREKHNVVSNGSCTTNAVVPVLKVIDDALSIKRGFFSTIHAYTATQRIVDGPARKELRRGRAAAINIIPTTTGASKVVGEVLKHLDGKIEGLAYRVPVVDASIVEFVIEVDKLTNAEEVNELFKQVANNEMKGIIQYCEDPIVSSDVIGNKHSAIIDAALTKVINGNLIKLAAWYDNEYGYSCRMVDVVKLL